MSRESRRMWKLAGKYSSVGVEMAAAVAIGTLGGYWLDEYFGTKPYLFWFGLAVGLGAATKAIIRVVRIAKRDELG